MAGTITHQWNGTVLTITSDSGTSSSDLKGAKGDDGPRGAQGAPGSSVAEDCQKLGGVAAENYALKTDTVENANKLGNVAAAQYVLKTDTVENANKLGNVAAESYALKTDTVENANKLGNVAAAQYARKNDVPAHNLLDNSDFRNPVNQRGASSYTGTGYSIDRWTGIGPSVNVSLGSGITVTITASSTIQYAQYLSDEAWIRLKGKPFTFALCTSDGAVHIATGTMTSGSELYDSPQITIGSTAFKMNLYKNANARPMVRIFASSESTITILWAALYEGSYTADTLPPYVPKGYGAELAECMRYYQRFDASMLSLRNYAICDETFVSVLLPLYIPMRIAPSYCGDTTGRYVRIVGGNTMPTTVTYNRCSASATVVSIILTPETVIANSAGWVDSMIFALSADL